MTKRNYIEIFIVSIIVLILLLLMYMLSLKVNPCYGYDVVGTFDREINSESDAITLALSWYSSMGYRFNYTDFNATREGNVWIIKFNPEVKEEIVKAEVKEEIIKKYIKFLNITENISDYQHIDTLEKFHRIMEVLEDRIILKEDFWGNKKIIRGRVLPC